MARTLRTFTFDLGDGDYIAYTRLDGYTLFVRGEIVGGFDTMHEAEVARDELRNQ